MGKHNAGRQHGGQQANGRQRMQSTDRAKLTEEVTGEPLHCAALQPAQSKPTLRIQEARQNRAHVSICFSSSSMHSLGSAVNISSPRQTHFCQR